MDADGSIDSTRIDPRQLVMGAIGLVGLTLVGYGVNSLFSFVGRAPCGNCATLPALSVAAVVLVGLLVLGFSIGLLARSTTE